MNYSEVKELLQAGFTAEEIRSFINPQNSQNNPQDVNTNISDNVPEKDSEKDDSRTADQDVPDLNRTGAPAENPNNDEKYNQLNATMEKLIKTIQSSNLNNSSVDSFQKSTDINTEVDKIMAGIIRPEREREVNEK